MITIFKNNILITIVFIIGLSATYCFGDVVPAKPARTSGMITNEHAKVHLGQVYTASFIDISVADDDYVVILIDITTNTFTNDEIHMYMAYGAGGDSIVKLFEGAHCTSSGTLITAYNFNRDIADSPETLIYHTPATIVTSGTVIYSQLIPGGTGGNAGGGTNSKNVEWVLEGNSYLIEIQNISGNTKPIGVEVDFYEMIEP